MALWFLGALIICGVQGQNENSASRLHDDLFDDMSYNKEVIPLLEGEGPLELEVGLSLTEIDLDRGTHLSGTGWLRMKWTDFRLSWDPAQYGGLGVLRVPGHRLWIPDIELYNGVDYGYNSFHAGLTRGSHQALIYPNGTVMYIPALPIKVNCLHGDPSMPTTAPQRCIIRLGSWTVDGTQIKLALWQDEQGVLDVMDLSELKSSLAVVVAQQPSSLKAIHYAGFPETYYSIDYDFTVQKAYVANFLSPLDQARQLVKNTALVEPLAALYERYQERAALTTTTDI